MAAGFSVHPLTQSDYLEGLKCRRRMWLERYIPSRADRTDLSPQVHREEQWALRRLSERLFPGGVRASGVPGDPVSAAAETRRLLADPRIPAIFGAVFDRDGVEIRVDVLERLPAGRFGLHRVSLAGSGEALDVEVLALQRFVLEHCGLHATHNELLQLDRAYVRGPDGVDPTRLFARVDCRRKVEARLREIRQSLRQLHELLDGHTEPGIEPGLHCRQFHGCEYWHWCTRSKPGDWILRLPGLDERQCDDLRTRGVQRIAEIPENVRLSALQARARTAARSGHIEVLPRLESGLHGYGPPAWYLEVKTISPAIPVYPRTRPFQVIPYQWSLAQVDAEKKIHHRHFASSNGRDRRREFAETLIETLGGDRLPVVVYAHFERRRLVDLRGEFPDLEVPLGSIIGRLADLLPVLRKCVYHPGFGGSFSIRRVAPVLVPGFEWNCGEELLDPAGCALAYHRIVAGDVDDATRRDLCQQIAASGRRSVEAMVDVHRTLLELAG